MHEFATEPKWEKCVFKLPWYDPRVFVTQVYAAVAQQFLLQTAESLWTKGHITPSEKPKEMAYEAKVEVKGLGKSDIKSK